MESLSEKVHYQTGEDGRQYSSLSGANDLHVEEDEGHNDGGCGAGQVEDDFRFSEVLLGLICNYFHEGFSRVHDNICNDGKANAEADDDDTCHHEGHLESVIGWREVGQGPNSQVGKQSEDEGQGNLEELNWLEVLPKDENLSQNHGAIPQNQPGSKGYIGDAITHDIGDGRDGRDSQSSMSGQGNAHGREK